VSRIAGARSTFSGRKEAALKRIAIALTALAMMTVATVANAQATRTWVSGVGDDVNPCSRTAPCKTFAGAISKTATGGEIDVLDPGGFGTINIIKSITIDGSGGSIGSILNSGTTGVIVNATATSDITLRNLSINGGNTGTAGIRILTARSVTIDNVVIFNQNLVSNGRGIDAQPTTTCAISILHSQIRNNSGIGIVLQGAANTVSADIFDTTVTNNTSHGIFATSGAKVAIHNSIIARNGITGIITDGAGTTVSVRETAIANNVGAGIQAGNSIAGSIVNFSNCTISGNSPGVNVTAFGAANSHQDNAVARNNVDFSGAAVGNAGHQ
jgi:hypothetical protein